jgi:hypothetical protein
MTFRFSADVLAFVDTYSTVCPSLRVLCPLYPGHWPAHARRYLAAGLRVRVLKRVGFTQCHAIFSIATVPIDMTLRNKNFPTMRPPAKKRQPSRVICHGTSETDASGNVVHLVYFVPKGKVLSPFSVERLNAHTMARYKARRLKIMLRTLANWASIRLGLRGFHQG